MNSQQNQYQCPVCTRTPLFSHPDTTIFVCTCGTVLNRLEGTSLVSKPIAVITDNVEHIQPGTTGSFEGKKFKVLGRFRAWCDMAVVNYWTILLDEQEIAWLAEGYGLYAVYRQSARASFLAGNDLKTIKPGSGTISIDRDVFLLQRATTCHRWEVQGEVYLPPCNPFFKIYELAAQSSNQKAVFELLDGYSISFTVFPASFASLNLANVNKDAYPGKEVMCTMCFRSFVVKTFPFAQGYSCTHCDTCYGYEGGVWKHVTKQHGPDINPAIRLNTKGTLNGILYEVIGYTLKKENNEFQSAWREYTLFNASEGFAFLSEFEGHWMFAKEQQAAPVLPPGYTASFTFDREPFSLFNRYSYEAFNIKGEFPYNVLLTNDMQVDEFISPPEMWIRETSAPEGVTWYKGEHVNSKVIADNFTLPGGLPRQIGVGAIEPTGYINPHKLFSVTAVSIIGFILCYLLAGMFHSNKVILDKSFTFGSDSIASLSFVTEKFYLGKWKSNLELAIAAPVDNSWFELAATLVDAQTGKEYGVEKGVEYYYGASEGERWSEGSTSETTYLDGIPAGQYYLQIHGTRESYAAGKVSNFQVTAVYDVPVYRNLLIGILVILIWPVVQFMRNSANEKRRWYNSPYSSYTYED